MKKIVDVIKLGERVLEENCLIMRLKQINGEFLIGMKPHLVKRRC